MKKRVVSLVMATIMAVSAMTGCGATAKDNAGNQNSQITESQNGNQQNEQDAEKPKREITYDLKDGVLTISGDGPMEDYAEDTNDPYHNRSPWYKSAEITKVVIEDGITHIGSFAFLSCEKLEEVVIADSVKSIGDCAFQSCKNLSKINVPKTTTEIGRTILKQTKWMEEQQANNTYVILNGYLLSVDRSVKEVSIPDGVICIDKDAFEKLVRVKYVNIPGSVKRVRQGAFARCTAEKLEIKEGVEILEANSISAKEVVIPKSVIYIGGGCSVPAEYKKDDFTIVNNVLVSCNLNKKTTQLVVIPEGVKYIANEAFSGFHHLEKVNIPDSVIGIGSAAFCGCINLDTITLGSGVKYIGELAFSGSGLKEIILNDGLETIEKEAFRECVRLKAIVIPDSVEYMGHGVFSGCRNLATVDMPKDVEYMGIDVFDGTKVAQEK